MRTFNILLALLLPLAAITTGAQERPSSAGRTSASGNAYFAGSNLRLAMPVSADLIAAGGRVSVEAPVGADAALAGGSVDVRAPIRQDLRVAGGAVTIAQDVGADLVAAGGNVQVENQVRIGGAAWLAGSDVHLGGSVGKDVRMAGNRLTVAADIAGDARLFGQAIELTPGTRIGGNLYYASPSEPVGLRTAQVSGSITRLDTPEDWHAPGKRGSGLGWLHPIFLAGMFTFGAILHLLFPTAVGGIARTFDAHPWRSLAIGFALVFTIPPLALLSMVTIIGLPFGFTLLLLYPLALLLGYLATAFFISRRAGRALKQDEASGSGKQLLLLGLALLVLSVALAIPFLGPLVFILATVAGTGALVSWAYLRIRAPAHGST